MGDGADSKNVKNKKLHWQLKQYSHSRNDFKLTNVEDIFTPQPRRHVHSKDVVDDDRNADLCRRVGGR